MTSSLLQAVERFLLPNMCVACEGPIEQTRPDTLVCGVCRARLRSVIGGCERCAQPLPPVGPCRFCAEWPAALGTVRSAVWLSDEAREIVHHLKYEGYRSLGAEIATIVLQRMPRPPRGILVPIPLGRRRLASRGFNQAADIARGLAARWNRPIAERVLRRTRDTRTQTELAPDEREENVRDAFAAVPPPGRRVSLGGAHGTAGAGVEGAIILVDDVLTTGATLAAAARALAGEGWSEIGAVTFARALPFAGRVS
jgi:predicted amidophosphoribosyltransferase